MENKTNKWNWMMDYCKKHTIPPAQEWAWKEAETAYNKAIPVEVPVIKPPFTLLDIDFIETLIRDNEEEGSYWGNLKHYNKRRERIKEQLKKMREAC